MQAEQAPIQSVERSFSVLEELAKHTEGLAVGQLAQNLGLAKSTVHRLLHNLLFLGYVAQHSETGRYRLTLKMFEVGSEVVGGMDAVSVARPYLEKLAFETGETVHLVVRDGLDIVYVYKAESGSMRMSSRLGLRIPLYCTGVGKAILSTLPHQEVEKVWNQSKVKALTPKTITSFNDLEKQLAVAKRQSWALDDEENELGIRCVAAALPGPGGRADTAFSVSALSIRMDEAKIQELSQRCLEVRAEILSAMGLRG